MTSYTNKPNLLSDGSVPADYYDYSYWEEGDKSLKGSYNGNEYSNNLAACKVWAQDLYNRWGPFESFLEFGCGRGWNFYGLAHLDIKPKIMLGIDISHYAITTAHEEVKPYLIEHDISDLSFLGGRSFDFIFSNDVLEHLTPIQVLNCLMHCKRIAKKRVVHLVSIGDGIDVPQGSPPSDQDQSHITLKSEMWWFDMFGNIGGVGHENGWHAKMVTHGRTIELDAKRE